MLKETQILTETLISILSGVTAIGEWLNYSFILLFIYFPEIFMFK